MKKYIIHNFSFYIQKKKKKKKKKYIYIYIYIYNHGMKKILNIKLIFHYQKRKESYLSHPKNGRERRKNKFVSKFSSFFFQKQKKT